MSLLINPVFPRALILGIIGGAGLVLTATYSRRGPMIYPVYAAVLFSLALLVGRYADLAYLPRTFAVFAGFCVASLELYIAVGALADRDRRRSVAHGRLPASALDFRLSLTGHLWRLSLLAAIGIILSAAVAFVAS